MALSVTLLTAIPETKLAPVWKKSRLFITFLLLLPSSHVVRLLNAFFVRDYFILSNFVMYPVTKGTTLVHTKTGEEFTFVEKTEFGVKAKTRMNKIIKFSPEEEKRLEVLPQWIREQPKSGTILRNTKTGEELGFVYQTLNGLITWHRRDDGYVYRLTPIENPDDWEVTDEDLDSRHKALVAESVKQRELEAEKYQAEREALLKRERELVAAKQKEVERKRQEEEATRLDEERKEKERLRLIELKKQEKSKIWAGFNEDFPSAYQLSNLIVDDEFDELAAAFVIEWFKVNHPDQLPPDLDQAKAIASTNSSTLLVARAGSGKTSTIVRRMVFWIRLCEVDINEILVLAFNKKAATEVEERYRAFMHLDDDAPVPHIMTLHAMARAFSPEIDVGINSAEVLQGTLLDLIKEDAYFEQFRTVMRSYFSADLKFFEENRLDLPNAEALKIRRGNVDIALAGHETKSFGEHLIANLLFEYGIPYTYEKLWHWGGRPYSPDFTIYLSNGGRVVVEYFGMAADNNNKEYIDQIGKKREYFAQREDSKLFEYYPHDITENGPEAFKQKIIQDLEKIGFSLQKLTDEEVWKRIEDRALAEFTEVSVTLIGRFRKAGLTPDNVDFKLASYMDSFDNETMFLRIVNEAYRRYLNTLAMNGADDFDGFMERASDALRSGISKFERKSGICNIKNLKQIYIDEFQDFSRLFAEMLDATLKVTEKTKLFCVGDNWQAINGFAGSDLRFFESFEASYSDSVRLISAKNYRSCSLVVNLGNALMQGSGAPATVGNANIGQGLVNTIDLSDLDLSPAEKDRFGDDDLLALVLKIFGDVIQKEGDLVLLSRTKNVPSAFGYASDNGYVRTLDGFLKRIRKFIPEELHHRIKISTAHGFKGLEAHTVVVIDAFKRRYPLLHPRLKFVRFSGLTEDLQIAEDRRLFYVAVTRAKHQLFLITDSRRPCDFLEMNPLTNQIPRLNLEKLPQWHSESPNALIVLSNIANYSGTFDVKDEIKASGYRWSNSSNPLNQGWFKKVEKAQFKIESIETEVWFRLADGIKVRVVDSGSNEVIDERNIYNGVWKT